MQGVLAGFATIIAVIGLGALLAHIKVLDLGSQTVLARLAFFVASPALMVTVLADTDVTDVFSRNLAATAVGVLVATATYVAVARLFFRRDLADTVIGSCARPTSTPATSDSRSRRTSSVTWPWWRPRC